MMQLFVSDRGFVKFYGMKSEKEFVKALKLFFKEMGSPKAFIVDTHPSQKSNEVRTFLNKVGKKIRVLEESTQHYDRTELYIGLMKIGVRKGILETNSPMRLCCYACEWRSAIMTLTSKNIFQLQGQNTYMATLVEMGDTPNLCQFGWYEWVYFFQNTADFPFQKEELGSCLGPTKNYGNEMCQWVLHQNGQVVPRRTLRRLRSEELTVNNETGSNNRVDFDADIKEPLGIILPLRP